MSYTAPANPPPAASQETSSLSNNHQPPPFDPPEDYTFEKSPPPAQGTLTQNPFEESTTSLGDYSESGGPRNHGTGYYTNSPYGMESPRTSTDGLNEGDGGGGPGPPGYASYGPYASYSVGGEGGLRMNGLRPIPRVSESTNASYTRLPGGVTDRPRGPRAQGTLPPNHPALQSNTHGILPTRPFGPTLPGGLYAPDDLVDERTLTESQREVLKKFDNREIDRDIKKVGLMDRMRDGDAEFYKDLMRKQFGQWKNLRIWILLVILIIVGILAFVFNEKIVQHLEPTARELTDHWWGWTIPAAIEFVLSFPPLFGAEIISLLVGVFYGIWKGWGIVSLGTFLGEMANYYAFSFLRKQSARLENRSMYWAKIAKISRDGNMLLILAIRYSVIPTHLSTTIFTVIGMPFWTYTIPTLLSQPRWLPQVYAGVMYKEKADGDETMAEKWIFWIVTGVFIALTIAIMTWVHRKMDAVEEDLKSSLRIRRADALNDALVKRGGKELESVHIDDTYSLDQSNKSATSLAPPQMNYSNASGESINLRFVGANPHTKETIKGEREGFMAADGGGFESRESLAER